MENEREETRRLIAQAMAESGIARAVNERDGTLTWNSRVVLNRRYLRKDEDGQVIEEPDVMFRRVARNLSGAELNYGASEEEREAVEEMFYQAMTRLEFLPNSPTLMNAGRELQQLSACFVLPVDDSLDSIFESTKQTALIHKSGGGTGFSFSRLRPEGDRVGTTGGVASGPVSFIRVFDSATDVVKQGGTRRGANMAILNVDHPDILRFINEKRNPDRLTNFNVSVAVDRSFMDKVREGGNYKLVNPRTGKVTGELNAKEVFRQITDCAWETGDPGLVFMDRINETNPNPHLGRIESTNPCVTGDTLAYTRNGLQRARDLFETQEAPEVATHGRFVQHNFQQATPIFFSGIRPVYRLKTKEGYQVRLTQDHRIMTTRGWVPAGELEPGQEIHLQNRGGGFGQNGSQEVGEILGWLVGDGTLKLDIAVPSFYGRKRELAPRFAEMMNHNVPEPVGTRRNYNIGVLEIEERDESRVSSAGFLKVAAEYGLTPGDKHHVPEKVFTGTEGMQAGFLRGLFSADGHVSNHPEKGALISLTSTSETMLQDVQKILLNLGIACRIYTDRKVPKAKEMADGKGRAKEYKTQGFHELAISKTNIHRFAKQVGFMDEFKTSLLNDMLESHRGKPMEEKFIARFAELVPDGTEEVFDLTEKVTHSFIANGIVVSNCGEQPLLPHESCNLGSINLARMLRYTDEAVEIDWDRLRETCRLAVRMLDNVIDVNEFPIPEIAEMSRSTRRIGVGVMGWADTLIQLAIRYDSDEAFALAREVMGFIQEQTHAGSAELATWRGVYPAWEGSRYDKPPEEGESVQMRNSAPVTIAPTGTISIIAGASSGIEPLYALSYERNVMDGTRLIEVNPHLEAVARHAGFYSDELMEQVARTGTLQGTEAPEWAREIFRTARDINPTNHVCMQAAFQAHTDNSVSKTINMPEEATPEEVREAYIMAYMTGCNGITVYRDGSKEDQVLSTQGPGDGTRDGEQNGHHPHPHPAPRPRPRVMEGVTVLVRSGHGNVYVTINSDEEGYPFEVFNTVGKAGGCDSAHLEAISRLISMLLRSGIEPTEITAQLRGITCCPAWDEGHLIRSIPDGIAHALSQHIGETPQRNGHGPNGGTRCPDCNAPAVYAEGCVSCSDPACGWNKCD